MYMHMYMYMGYMYVLVCRLLVAQLDLACAGSANDPSSAGLMTVRNFYIRVTVCAWSVSVWVVP